MSRAAIMPPVVRPSLSSVLHRAHLRVAMIAVVLVGISIFVVGFVTLRTYMLDNLALAASAMSYTVEAAVVFDDADAAIESLTVMAGHNPIASVSVLDQTGNTFVRWQSPGGAGGGRLERLLAELFLAEPALAPVHHDGRQIGEVRVQGSGRDLLFFLLISLVSALVCLVISGVAAYRMSYRATNAIVEPLQALAATAARARRERLFGRRVAPVAIAELHELGVDFNALLEELEGWQAQVRSESARLEYKASHDPLTGLANRSRFEGRLVEALAGADADRYRVAVFFIDADRFKEINDEFGHEAGDAVLRTIALRLRSHVREGDMVARLGGDEFAIMLAPLRAIEHARRIAENIQASMESDIVLPSGARHKASLSIGIAFSPEHARDLAGLLKRADQAMYKAKKMRRGSVHFFSEEDLLEQTGEDG